MLSTKALTSAQATHDYFFDASTYYLDASTRHTAWLGEGAQRLSLSGSVDSPTFRALLNGQWPDGTSRLTGNSKSLRPGYDLTFNAPKSVSLVALIGGDKRLMAAHQAAVRVAVCVVERTCAQARRTQQAVTHLEDTQNLVVATFLEDTSRALDPHLHTHCVVLNLTQRADGLWRALASCPHDTPGNPNGFWERVRAYQRHLGAVYRTELAYQVRQLGYALEVTRPTCWDIRGVAPEDLHQFSKRRQAIEQYLQAHGQRGAAASAAAALHTRTHKRCVTQTALQAHGRSVAHTDFDALVQDARARAHAQAHTASESHPTDDGTVSAAFEAHSRAVLSALPPTFTRTRWANALWAALEPPTGSDAPKVDANTVLRHLTQRIEQGHVYAVGVGEGPGEGFGPTRWTTAARWAFESEQLSAVSRLCQRRLTPLTPARLSYAMRCSQRSATPAQQATLHALLHAPNALLGVRLPRSNTDSGSQMGHPAPEGAVRTVVRALRDSGQSLVCVVPTAHSQRRWQAHGLPHVRTMAHVAARFAQQRRRYGRVSGQGVCLLVLDAERVSEAHWTTLLNVTEATGARLLPVLDATAPSDTRLGPALWATLGMPCVTWPAQTAHTLTPAKDPSNPLPTHEATPTHTHETLAHALGQRLVITEHTDACHARWAQRVAQLSPLARQATAVVFATPAACAAFNQRVSERRAAHTSASGQLTVTTAQPVWLSPSAKRTVHAYPLGATLIWSPSRDARSHTAALSPHRAYRVTAQSVDTGRLTLTDGRGRHTTWAPNALTPNALDAVRVFAPTPQTWCEGDPLVWQGASTQRLAHGEVFTLMRVHGRWLRLRAACGRRVWWRAPRAATVSHPHLSLGFAVTPQRAHAQRRWVLAIDTTGLRCDAMHRVLTQAGGRTQWLARSTDAWRRTLQPEAPASVIGAVQRADAARGQTPLSACTPDALAHVEQRLRDATAHALAASAPSADGHEHAHAERAVTTALLDLGERTAGVDAHQLFERASQWAEGRCSVAALHAALHALMARGGWCQPTPTQGASSPHALGTTPRWLAQERTLRHWAQHPRVTHRAVATQDVLDQRSRTAPLSASHQHALEQLATSRAPLLVLQGAPGTGKSTLLKALVSVWGTARVPVRLLATTHTAVHALRDTGAPVATLQRFLRDATGRVHASAHTTTATAPAPWVIVDEASMMSTSQAVALVHELERTGARGLLVGDTKQLPSVAAGNPMALFIAAGVPTVHLTDIRRQRHRGLLRAVQATYQGEMARGLALLGPHCVDANALRALNTTALAYVVGHVMEHPDTLVMTPRHTERHQINQAVRRAKAAEGTLTGPAHTVTVLTPVSLTRTAQGCASRYQVGDVLCQSGAHRDDRSAGERYHTITQTVPEQHALVTQDTHGQRRVWCLPEPMRGSTTLDAATAAPDVMDTAPPPIGPCYRRAHRTVHVGDTVRFTRAHAQHGVALGALGTVTALDEQHLWVHVSDRTVRLANTDPADQHWDWGYAITVHAAQGLTVSRAIAYLPNATLPILNQRHWLVALSRAQDTATVVTDNKARLLSTLLANTGDPVSALEVIREWPTPTPTPAATPMPTPVLPATPAIHLSDEALGVERIAHDAPDLDR